MPWRPVWHCSRSRPNWRELSTLLAMIVRNRMMPGRGTFSECNVGTVRALILWWTGLFCRGKMHMSFWRLWHSGPTFRGRLNPIRSRRRRGRGLVGGGHISNCQPCCGLLLLLLLQSYVNERFRTKTETTGRQINTLWGI